MNILLVIDFFAFDNRGGAGTVFYEYAKGLAAAGHNVSVIHKRHNESTPLRADVDGVHFYTYDNSHTNFLLLTLCCVLNTYRLFREADAKAPVEVISIQHPLPSLGIALSSRGRRLPKVYSFQAPWEMEYRGHKVVAGAGLLMKAWYKINLLARRWVENFAVNSSCKVIVLSEYMKGLLIKTHGVNESKIAVIPGGIDIDAFKPPENKDAARDKLSIPKDKFILLSIRRLVPRMGLENLISAMAVISKEKKDIQLIIGGRGPLEGKLKELTQGLGLGNIVRFPGFISHEHLPLYYQAADLFVLPTIELEGFGLVTLEALSSGLPVLGTDIGATTEILSRFNKNFLFKDTDPATLARQIAEFVTRKEADLSAVCREFAVKNYSWGVIIPKIDSLFVELVKADK